MSPMTQCHCLLFQTMHCNQFFYSWAIFSFFFNRDKYNTCSSASSKLCSSVWNGKCCYSEGRILATVEKWIMTQRWFERFLLRFWIFLSCLQVVKAPNQLSPTGTHITSFNWVISLHRLWLKHHFLAPKITHSLDVFFLAVLLPLDEWQRGQLPVFSYE